MGGADGWDRRADAFDKPLRDPSDPFLKLVMEYAGPSPDFTDVLDIGCGTGVVSLGIRDRVRSIRGIDLSPRMVEIANRNAESCGCNAEFSVFDWDTGDVSKLGRYNLTLAHMTPAIHDGPSFAKMLAVSSGWCFLAGYISRESPVWDRIYRIVGEPDVPEYRKLTSAQETLWDLGKVPHLHQYRRRRSWEWTAEYTKMFYTEAVRGYTSMTPEQEAELCAWIDSESEDGMFRDESDPVIGVLCWDMSESARAGTGF